MAFAFAANAVNTVADNCPAAFAFAAVAAVVSTLFDFSLAIAINTITSIVRCVKIENGLIIYCFETFT